MNNTNEKTFQSVNVVLFMRRRYYLPAAFLILLLTAHFIRSLFGIDFTDESYYLALGKAFALGSIPYREEFSLQQSAAFLTEPFISAFMHFQQGTESIVLFSRILYLVFSTSVYLVISKLVSGKLNFNFALTLVILSPLAIFTPFSIFALSYNTLAFLLLSLAYFLLFPLLFQKEPIFDALIGLSLGLATVAYLPLLPIFGGVVLLYGLYHPNRNEALLRLLSGFALGLLPLLYEISRAGIDSFVSAAKWHSSYGAQGGGLQKIWSLMPRPASILGVLLLIYGFRKFKNHQEKILKFYPITAVTLAAIDGFQHHLMAHYFLNSLALYLVPMLFALDSKIKFPSAEFAFWSLVLVGFGMISYASNSGPLAAAGVSLIFILALFLWIGTRTLTATSTIRLCGALVAFFLCIFQYLYVYRDLPISAETAKMSVGPFKGLRTHPEKANFADRLQAELAKLPPQSNLLSWDSFPAAYLFTLQRHLTPANWLMPFKIYPMNRDKVVHYFQQQGKNPDFILKINHFFNTPDDQESLLTEQEDPLWTYFQKFSPKEIYQDPDFSIFKLDSPTATN